MCQALLFLLSSYLGSPRIAYYQCYEKKIYMHTHTYQSVLSEYPALTSILPTLLELFYFYFYFPSFPLLFMHTHMCAWLYLFILWACFYDRGSHESKAAGVVIACFYHKRLAAAFLPSAPSTVFNGAFTLCKEGSKILRGLG